MRIQRPGGDGVIYDGQGRPLRQVVHLETVDYKGVRVPAPQNHEVWAKMVFGGPYSQALRLLAEAAVHHKEITGTPPMGFDGVDPMCACRLALWAAATYVRKMATSPAGCEWMKGAFAGAGIVGERMAEAGLAEMKRQQEEQQRAKGDTAPDGGLGEGECGEPPAPGERSGEEGEDPDPGNCGGAED
jgi:hypothetical protein